MFGWLVHTVTQLPGSIPIQSLVSISCKATRLMMTNSLLAVEDEYIDG